MDLRPLNKICFTVCIVCIMVGVVTALAMVWSPGINESLWKLLATDIIVLLGATATLSVSRTFGGRAPSDDTPV